MHIENITSGGHGRSAGANTWTPRGDRLGFRALALSLMQLCWVGSAAAQTPIPPSTQFDVTGFLEEATVNTIGDPLSGGSLKVNGHTVTVPTNTVVIMPAAAFTWQELFTQAPQPYLALNETGLALADLPAPLASYEVHVVGNRVLPDANHLTDQYIAGLIYISQQGLNSGAGFINFIDYTLGELRVGGLLNDPACAQGGTALTNPLCSGARVRINDPVGRFGRVITPDARFSVDDANPTIIAGTGFPMCLPRVAPPAVAGGAETDLLCPQGNRPKDVAGNFVPSISMADPATLVAGQLPDPRVQAPLEVGDYITFAGTLVVDVFATGFGPTEGPFPLPTAGGTGNTYIAAHTITNNVAIYTAAGTNPAYVMTEVALIGTGGLTVIGAGEAAIRTRFEGMTTDPSRQIHLYGVDVAPVTGVVTDRDFGIIGVDQGPPTGAVKGRWRFRPPCAVFGTDPTTIKFDKLCIMNAANTFLPPPREVRAVIDANPTALPPSPAGWVFGQTTTFANGIIAGQYHAPILEYIFPENIPGTPIVENNFNALDFLAKGGYASSLGTIVGVLNPWPSNILPGGACQVPVANAGGPYTVASGGTVTLAATSTGTAPTFAWTAPVSGSLSNLAIANPVFTAPVGAQSVPLSLKVTNACGTSTATTSVTVNGATLPTVNHIAPITVASGAPVSLTASCINGPCTFVWTQTGTPVVLVPNPFTGATISFTLTLPVGAPGTTLQFSVVATNAAGASAPEFTTVTVNPTADAVTIASAEYRTGKQRLILNATSSIVSPSVILTLDPYVTTTGTTFDPATLGNVFTNNGGGLYIITLVGAPQPGAGNVLRVRSNLGGVSPLTALTRIRP